MRGQPGGRTLFSLSNALDSDLTAKLSLALTRGAGGSRMSVGSRCPRLESVRRGKPLQPTRPAKGSAPPGNAATLRSPQFESVAPDIRSLALISTAHKPSPMRGRGTAAAVDEVPTQAPDFFVSLSIAFDSGITANLIDALPRRRG